MERACLLAAALAWLVVLGGACSGGSSEPDGDGDADGDADAEADGGTEAGASPEADLEAPTDAEADAAPAGPCDGVECSGRGRCVPVDRQPTCACAPEHYPVGLECLRDPCESGGTCYYVDSEAGQDGNPGTRGEPWQTLGRVQDAMAGLEPGDHVLFKRGGSWTGVETFRIRAVRGAAGQAVTFGAYDSGARPRLRAIRLDQVSHVTVRDLESVGSASGSCLSVTNASHVVVQDLHAHGCASNGLLFAASTEYGTLVDNRVWDVRSNDALVVHSPSPLTEDNRVGDHFWIVDNVVPGAIGEQPVDVATGSDEVAGARDIKVVGNLLTGGGNGCIVLGHGSSVGWIVANTMGNCTRTETAYSLSMGGLHGENSGDEYQVVGNVIFHSLMAAVQVQGEPPVVTRVHAHHNTIVQVIGRRSAVRSSVETALSFDHNVVWPTGTQAHVSLRAAGDVVAMDDNWYVPADLPACSILGRSLADWTALSGFDTRSRCAPVPGLEEPSSEEAADVGSWTSPTFLARFVPDASWAGCAERMGAFDCEGNRYVEFRPFPAYDDNDGYGWEGPIVVRQRYRLRG